MPGVRALEGLVVVLALVGAAAILRAVVGSYRSAAKVLEATNFFQAASIEAMSAIGQTPPNVERQLKSVRRWDFARRTIRELTPKEQRHVVLNLRERSFPISEISEMISVFVEQQEEANAGLDEELAVLTRGSNESSDRPVQDHHGSPPGDFTSKREQLHREAPSYRPIR